MSSVSQRSTYKYCIVPQCKNTSYRTPNKLFFKMPKGETIRKMWCSAMKRDFFTKLNKPLSSTSMRHCCEDHFEIEKDMENYCRWKLMGCAIKLKSGVVPHIFDCQRPTTVKLETNAAAKINQETLNNPSASTTVSDIEWVDCGSCNVEISPINIAKNEKKSNSSETCAVDKKSQVKKKKVKKKDFQKSKKCQMRLASCTTAACSPIKPKLPNDMENYTEYQLMGSVSQIRLREDCLPTKFACQTDGKRQIDNEITPPLAVKRQRSEPIEECEIEQAHSTQSVSVAEVQPGPSSDTLDKSRSSVEFICQPIDTKRIKLELADPEDTQPLDSQDVKFEFTQFENDDDDTQNLIDSNDIPSPSTFIAPEGVTSIKQESFVMKIEIESEDFLEQSLTTCDNSDNTQSNPSTQTEQISNNEGDIQEEQQDNSLDVSKESMSDTDTISQTDSKPKRKRKIHRGKGGGNKAEKRKRNRERGKARNLESSLESCGALIIRNLPKDENYSILPSFFQYLFCNQEFEYDYVAEMRDPNQMPTGQYILKFRPRSATEAVKEKILGSEYEGNKLEVLEGDVDNLVRWAIAMYQQRPQIIKTEKPLPDMPFKFSDKIHPYHYTHGSGKKKKHYGLKPETIDAFDLKDVSQNRLTNQIKVYNLDPSMEHQHIREIFGMAGIVMNVNIYRTKHTSSEKPPFPITALVEYDHPVEALQAISMFNGHEIYNRKLTVTLYGVYKRNTMPNGVGPTLGPGIGYNGRRLLGVRNFIELQEIRKNINDFKSSFKGETLPKDISDELASVKNDIRSEFYNELLGLMNEISTLRNELQTLKNEVQSRDNKENVCNDVPSEDNTATKSASDDLRSESNKNNPSDNLESEYRHEMTRLKNEIEIICKINNLRRPKPEQPGTDTDTNINIVTNETQTDIVDSIEMAKDNNQNSNTLKTNEQSTKKSNQKSTQMKQAEEQKSQNKNKINALDKKSTEKPKTDVSIKPNAGDKTQKNTTKNKDPQKNDSGKQNKPNREEILKTFKDLMNKGSTAEELMDISVSLLTKPTAQKRPHPKMNVSQFDTGFNGPWAPSNFGSQGFAGPRDAPFEDYRMDGPRPFMDPWLGRQDDRSYPGQMGRDPFDTYGRGNMPPQQYQDYSGNCPPGNDIHQPTNPIHPPANPIHFSNNPLHPSTNPMHLPTNPMHPLTNPMHLPTNPMHPPSNPMHPPANPMHPPKKLIHPPTNPMDPRTKSMHPPTNPMHPPTNPMHSPTNPMHAPTNPMHPPTNPLYPQMTDAISSESQKQIRQTVLVSFSNLPPKVTHAVLTDKLKEDFQSIQYVEFTSRGDKAIVKFLNKLEADRCIHKFNRSKVDGHIIDVKGL